jgi:hypothetical protein
MTRTTNYDFERVIRLMREHSAGCLIESYVKVEHGEAFLRAAWDAFLDLGEYFDEVYEGERQMLNQFILMLEDEVRLKDMGLPVCL